MRKRALGFHFQLLLICLSALSLTSFAGSQRIPLQLKADDVIPTGNQRIALLDGALTTFNVLSMRDRGLLHVTGERGAPVLQPYFTAGGKSLLFRNPSWELIEYWIPTSRLTVDGIDVTLTWCAPPDSRAVFLRMTIANHRTGPVQ